MWLLAASASGQTPPAPGPPPAAGEPAPAPGVRIVSGQAAVVGGNSAGARERALEDAIKQAVDQVIGALLDAPTRAAQAKILKAVVARGRSFVPRYRTLEEGEVNGVYTVRLEAEVEEDRPEDEVGATSRRHAGAGDPNGTDPGGRAPGRSRGGERGLGVGPRLGAGGGGNPRPGRRCRRPGRDREPRDRGSRRRGAAPRDGAGLASLPRRGSDAVPEHGVDQGETSAAERAFVAAGAGERPETARAECAARPSPQAWWDGCVPRSSPPTPLPGPRATFGP